MGSEFLIKAFVVGLCVGLIIGKRIGAKNSDRYWSKVFEDYRKEVSRVFKTGKMIDSIWGNIYGRD